MVEFERSAFRRGLRGPLPGDLRSGVGEASYLINSFGSIYRYILQNPHCTYAELETELDLSKPVIINNIAVLKRRGIVAGITTGPRRKMQFYIQREINFEEINGGK